MRGRLETEIKFYSAQLSVTLGKIRLPSHSIGAALPQFGASSRRGGRMPLNDYPSTWSGRQTFPRINNGVDSIWQT